MRQPTSPERIFCCALLDALHFASALIASQNVSRMIRISTWLVQTVNLSRRVKSYGIPDTQSTIERHPLTSPDERYDDGSDKSSRASSSRITSFSVRPPRAWPIISRTLTPLKESYPGLLRILLCFLADCILPPPGCSVPPATSVSCDSPWKDADVCCQRSWSRLPYPAPPR